MFGNFGCYFENVSLKVKTAVDTIWAMFGLIGVILNTTAAYNITKTVYGLP